MALNTAFKVPFSAKDSTQEITGKLIAALQAGIPELQLELDGGTLEASDESDSWYLAGMGDYNVIVDWESMLKNDPEQAVRDLMNVNVQKEGLDEQSGKSITKIQEALRKTLKDI